MCDFPGNSPFVELSEASTSVKCANFQLFRILRFLPLWLKIHGQDPVFVRWVDRLAQSDRQKTFMCFSHSRRWTRCSIVNSFISPQFILHYFLPHTRFDNEKKTIPELFILSFLHISRARLSFSSFTSLLVDIVVRWLKLDAVFRRCPKLVFTSFCTPIASTSLSVYLLSSWRLTQLSFHFFHFRFIWRRKDISEEKQSWSKKLKADKGSSAAKERWAAEEYRELAQFTGAKKVHTQIFKVESQPTDQRSHKWVNEKQ